MDWIAKRTELNYSFIMYFFFLWDIYIYIYIYIYNEIHTLVIILYYIQNDSNQSNPIRSNSQFDSVEFDQFNSIEYDQFNSTQFNSHLARAVISARIRVWNICAYRSELDCLNPIELDCEPIRTELFFHHVPSFLYIYIYIYTH